MHADVWDVLMSRILGADGKARSLEPDEATRANVECMQPAARAVT